jgi:hypothetical protein
MICHGFMALFDGSLGMWMRGGDSESAMSLCILATTDLIAQHSEYVLIVPVVPIQDVHKLLNLT